MSSNPLSKDLSLDGLSTKELEDLRQELLTQLGRVEAALEAAPAAEGADDVPPGRRSRSSPPVRTTLLDALDDLGVPAYSRELVLYLKARYGREIPATRFGSLSKDEEAAFNSSRARAVYLCHGVTADRFEVIRRMWARSDWPLEERIVAPTTGRVQQLRMTVALCRIAQEAGATAADPMMLRIIAADHARALPGVRVVNGRFDLEQWTEVAKAELEKFEPRDRERRIEAAAKLSQRPEAERLFGVPDTMLVGLASKGPGASDGGEP